MNEDINLVEILKDCPKGTPLYSIVHGYVEFFCIDKNNHTFPIKLFVSNTEYFAGVTKEGKYISDCDGECILFPSKENRDWSKFKVNKPKFDPKTLQSFDRILVLSKNEWVCRIISHIKEDMIYVTSGGFYDYCIPYNEETKHLVGTNKEAPEYYRYWEN